MRDVPSEFLNLSKSLHASSLSPHLNTMAEIGIQQTTERRELGGARPPALRAVPCSPREGASASRRPRSFLDRHLQP